MVTCRTCARLLNERTEVRHEMDGQTFCSLDCVYKYRGKRRFA